MDTELNELIEQYNEVAAKYTELNNKLDEVKLEKASLKNQLIDALKARNLEAVGAHGKNVQIVKKRNYSILDVEKFTALDDYYHTASLFSINSNKLNAFCRDLEAVNDGVLPDDLMQSLKVFEYEDISVRKIK